MKKIISVIPLMTVLLLASCQSSIFVKPDKYYTITLDARANGMFVNGEQKISLTLKAGTKFVPYIRLIQPISKENEHTFYYYKYKDNDDMINYDDVIANDISLEAWYLELRYGGLPWYMLIDDWKTIKRMSVTNPNPEKCYELGAYTFNPFIINGKKHEVRIIGFNHDDLVNGGKAGITFEFFNLITDEDGNAYKTIWDNKMPDEKFQEYLNHDFPNSVLNEFLNVGDECVFNMFPDDLKTEGIIEEVKKPVAQTKDQIVSTYNTKLFPLAASEITNDVGGSSPLNEGDQYEYWIENDTNEKRKKSPVNGNAENYWLRSPNDISKALYVDSTGYLSTNLIDETFAVAPAFCI